MGSSLLDPVQELQDVVIAEPTVTALADPEERELAAVAKSLDGVDVQVQHLGDLGRREKLPDLVRHHWWYWFLLFGHSARPLAPGRCGGFGS